MSSFATLCDWFWHKNFFLNTLAYRCAPSWDLVIYKYKYTLCVYCFNWIRQCLHFKICDFWVSTMFILWCNIVGCHTQHSTIGDRAFAATTPAVWNCLPEEVWLSTSPKLFRHRLKAELFQHCLGPRHYYYYYYYYYYDYRNYWWSIVHQLCMCIYLVYLGFIWRMTGYLENWRSCFM